MTTDDTDNGWDSLADEFGLSADKPTEKAEKPAPPARSGRPAPSRPARDPRPEIEGEADDFGAGLNEEVVWKQAALYDPGPEAVAEDSDELGEAPEPLDDTDDPEDGPPTAEGAGEGTEGGKKRRRRRRRRKKGGAGAPPADVADVEGEADDEEAEPTAANGVEEGEAPAEVEGDDEEAPPSAVDEEMEAEAARPRPQWNVMTWNELVAKLHRPG